ncbi:MAG: hypothetical protein DRI91_06005, partial [Aquificota bacterium]
HCEKWQIRQADYAIKLYQYFLSSKEKADDVQASFPEAWDWLQEEASRLLRLKHRSYRTEKTYLGWVRRFGEFLNYKVSQWWQEVGIDSEGAWSYGFFPWRGESS